MTKFAWALLVLPILAQAKVLELSDRFLPLRNEGMWLVMFYAPWCGHCKKLEPVFKHVEQSLAQENILRIGRVDCTRFTNVATEFAIKGYPTILFLKGDATFSYDGDRTREDIVAFAERLLLPPVKELRTVDEVEKTLAARETSFFFVGPQEGQLYKTYEHIATIYQQHEFFYQAPSDVMAKITGQPETDAIRVFKDKKSFKFEDIESEMGREPRAVEDQLALPPQTRPEQPNERVNESLFSWIAKERFPMFVKITRGKFQRLMSTKKYAVLAVLEENKIGSLSPEMEQFRDMVQDVVRRNWERYHDFFQFGWTGSPELANSVAMETLSLPNLLVVNTTSYQHHLPDDDPMQLTPEAIQIFLDDILAGSAPVYGGSSYSVRLYRAYYELKTSLIEMWRGNPALTAVLFGLPLGFFALICYSVCCADIMDAEEEDEEEPQHEKTD